MLDATRTDLSIVAGRVDFREKFAYERHLDAGQPSAQQCVVEEVDHSPLVFFRMSVQAVGMPRVGDLPDRCRFTCLLVHLLIQFLAAEPVARVDPEDGSWSDSADEVFQVGWR